MQTTDIVIKSSTPLESDLLVALAAQAISSTQQASSDIVLGVLGYAGTRYAVAVRRGKTKLMVWLSREDGEDDGAAA